ncbi:hypothetical protein AB3Y40_20355 [Yoonia sp. R2331]|uniref:hypothetical protein n=1 Tax=Yoonia sp. R2331 TaxID=3237238 RepID=UPI0034E43D61
MTRHDRPQKARKLLNSAANATVPSEIGEDGDLSETLPVRVQDFTDTNDPDKAPTLHRFTITFQPDRFEALMSTPADRAKRNEALLELAQEMSMTAEPQTDAWLAFEGGQLGRFVIAAEEIEACVKLAQDLGRLP